MALFNGTHVSDELIVALLDGELTPAERLDAQRHLHGCPRCTNLRERQVRADRALAAALALETLRPPTSDEPAPSWKLRPAVGAAGTAVVAGAAGALVVAGVLALRGHRRPAIVG